MQVVGFTNLNEASVKNILYLTPEGWSESEDVTFLVARIVRITSYYYPWMYLTLYKRIEINIWKCKCNFLIYIIY